MSSVCVDRHFLHQRRSLHVPEWYQIAFLSY
jgi:hypothetical protein